jgi:phytoene/squalene synthetase
MTNIIKDCRVDARRGVSYIPARYVADAPGGGLRPESCRDVYTHAISHLDAGLAYTMAVPRSEAGIRRFLLGSLLPAIATLEMAATTSQVHPRIDRDKMMEILELITAPDTSDAAIIAWYRAHCDRLLAALPAA